ncbi:MAG: hypothetical protein ACI837_003434 [Crocinitomicaceae bacterium]|jgi:hypothetical protein
MEFKLNYSNIASTACGIFIEDAEMMKWVDAASKFNSDHVRFFPIPGIVANSLSGVLLISDGLNDFESGSHQKVQSIGNSFFLLENSEVSPRLNEDALLKRFGRTPHFFHPIYGLIELEELKDWASFVELKPLQVTLTQAEKGPEIPYKLGNYFIREVEPEEVLKTLIEKAIPDRSSLDHPQLTSWEKIKLKALRTVLSKKGKKKATDKIDKEDVNESDNQDINTSHKKSWWKRNREKMEEQLEDLEERNKRELDKLMDMLEKDPDEALKYALPIDRSGFSRGRDVGFTMMKRWGSRSGGGSPGGGNVNLEESRADVLRSKYNQMATRYVETQQWEKASFVYLELLSNPTQAAIVLQQGKKYEAAAAIFLSRCKDKARAAECYESGNFNSRAIELYEELDQQLKVGDLQTKMGNGTQAELAYNKEITKMLSSKRYFSAGIVAHDKLSNVQAARDHYTKGWELEQRPNDCLNAFLDTFKLDERRKNIVSLHKEEFEGEAAHRFLEVLKNQLNHEKELQDDVELIVYETVARNSKKDKKIVQTLKNFNKGELVLKDIMRFRLR